MDRDLSNRGCGVDLPSVRDLQATLFPPMSPERGGVDSPITLPRVSSGSFLGQLLLKSSGDDRCTSGIANTPVAKAREQRAEYYSIGREQPCPAQQPARWPAECQVIDERVEHISFVPPSPEQYYVPHGREVTPKPVGEELGTVVFQYYPASAINYFNRSCTGGCPYFQTTENQLDDLQFESRFESGNLAKAIKLTPTFYELYVRNDLYTNRHAQWFYFRVSNVKKHTMYRFSIVNLSKGESLYCSGMKPLMYSTRDATLHSIGWRRCGENIAYYCNENGNPDEDQPPTYTLTFTMEFSHEGDVVYLAHSYPYTYTDLQDYLMTLVNHPVKSAFSSLRLLCRSLAGNNVYYVTVTNPSTQIGDQKKKKAIIISARVHPGESPSSWMMKGLLDFLTGDTSPARELRDKFIFKLIPMLNPDGVIVGNSRCSLTGRDLNRQYRTVIRETYPTIWHTKLMIRRLIEECGVAMYCDFHAHSRQNNVFIYGCENRRGYDRYLQEQIFPLMLHKNSADKFSFENCKFRIQRAKEGTGRVVMWMMGICNSYTMEASFAGSDLGPRADTHFSVADYEQMGRVFCQTLLDYYDEAPNKEKLRTKILKRLVKRGSTADEPTNITLSDYSSDEGDSSSSDEAGRGSYSPPLAVPPPSPNLPPRILKKKAPAPSVKTLSKSPTVQRKVLPVFHANLELSLGESDSESDTGIVYEMPALRPGRNKAKKHLRRKKTKKKITDHEHTDTEVELKKHSRKGLSVLELIPAEKLRSQSWNRFGSCPIPNIVFLKKRRKNGNKKLCRALDIRHVRNTTRQLAEVQAKLIALRRRIWTGMNDEDCEDQPLSWGYSSFTTGFTNQPREASKKIKDSKKSKSCDDEKKTEKKSKRKCKKQKEEAKKPPPKKKSNGIKRQTAVDWSTCDNRRTTTKSKSLQEESKTKTADAASHIGVDSGGELDDHKKKSSKKKKKRKGNWEKKTKTLVTINNFVKKPITD